MKLHRRIPALAVALAALSAAAELLPDIASVPADLAVPPMEDGPPAPGRRVRAVAPGYEGTQVYHALYLPADWKEGAKYPVIAEYPGNGPFRNAHGDARDGRVEEGCLGYGLSGGRGFLWINLPFVSEDGRRTQRQWWGDVRATVDYAKAAVAEVCRTHGGDPSAVFLAGFSRGAIACNYIGLHDDEIAALWRGFICHSHYDGVRAWSYEGSDRAAAARRLARLNGRPQFISHEGSVEETRQYLAEACPQGAFSFQVLPYRNHTDAWVLRPIPERAAARRWLAAVLAEGTRPADPPPPAVARKRLRVDDRAPNRLLDENWRAWGEGFSREDGLIVCRNGNDAAAQRGAGQTLVLNQEAPLPILASAWSKAENAGGRPDTDYALYLDLQYMDGTPLWGQAAPFSTGTHDWERREVVVIPSKPVRLVSFYLLLRNHAGTAWFRDPVCYEMTADHAAVPFDGRPVIPVLPPAAGFLVRDAAAGSDWVAFQDGRALGLHLETREIPRDGATFIEAALRDTTGRDRAVTLVYTLPMEEDGWRWLASPRRDVPAVAPAEYAEYTRFPATGGTRLSTYPFAAVARPGMGRALGLDLGQPVFFRTAYHAGTRELTIAFDLGLAPEKPEARIRFCHYSFDPAWGFRAALQKYYELFPDYFRCRIPEQGLWMPFAKISAVEGWQDFGFRFKEGTNETAWDDAHGIRTFNYTEPQTWWMRMPDDAPRTPAAALAQAEKMAAQDNRQARALLTSGYHDAEGNLTGLFRDTPWCDGIVWSLNAAPGVPGEVTFFKNNWNEPIKAGRYGPARKADLDGEYVDSSEGYATAELNYRREHFAAMQTPLVFAADTFRPAIFRGLAVYEYVRAQAEDVHAMDRFMMANGTPGRLCWLAPWLDVMGTETDWNRGGRWRPMPDEDLLYRRALCGPKPYGFLMNTVFEDLPPDRVEAYMKRCLAYGMFPGFFSHNASERQYFTRPELYNRDRPLFKKYVPLCKRVAEAGWQPVTLAASSHPRVYVERFGERLLTVYNDDEERRETVLTLKGLTAERGMEQVRGQPVAFTGGEARLTLDAGEVLVIELE